MEMQWYMPTRVLFGERCVEKNSALLGGLGKRALIVTGRCSARINGSLKEMEAALASQGVETALFDRVETNPAVATVREGAQFAREAGVDCVVGIGGGSPMDAAKAIALLAYEDIPDESLFSGTYAGALPMALVPTTAGTGSEVTPYSVLMNPRVQSKTSIASPLLFPRLALLDARYTGALPPVSTVNTAVDALSHAVEGSLSVRRNALSDAIAAESMRLIVGTFPAFMVGSFDFATRETLLYASMLAGMVIAHTGTTSVHAMGYSLTYFHNVDHGRANGLLLASFLRFVQKSDPATIRRVLDQMGLADLDAFATLLRGLLGAHEPYTDEELERFADIAAQAKSRTNSTAVPTRDDLLAMYRESLL